LSETGTEGGTTAGSRLVSNGSGCADRVAAVSRAGFTRFARPSAKANGIEAYTLSERNAFPDGKALAHLEVVQWLPQARITSFSWAHRAVMIDPRGPIPELSQQEMADLTTHLEEDQWHDAETNTRTSLMQVLSNTLTWNRLLDGAALDGSHTAKTLRTEFGPPHRYYLDRATPEGTWIALASVTGDFDVWLEPHAVKANRVTQYRGTDDEPVIELHEYDGRFWGLDGQTVIFAPIAAKQ
jgi:hypothetical protein